MEELPILFQDSHLIAVNKPAGMLVHRTEWFREEGLPLLQRLRDQIGCRVYPVHRLDRPTSGVIVFALSSKIASGLCEEFREHRVVKRYQAVVRGWTEDAFCVDYAIADDKEKERVEARTGFRTVSKTELPFAVGRYETARYSLVEAVPETGRLHQIRKHLKHIFHPIVGDVSHGDSAHNRFFRSQFDCHRLLLHAETLAFHHPVTSEWMTITAEADTKWRERMHALGFEIT